MVLEYKEWNWWTALMTLQLIMQVDADRWEQQSALSFLQHFVYCSSSGVFLLCMCWLLSLFLAVFFWKLLLIYVIISLGKLQYLDIKLAFGQLCWLNQSLCWWCVSKVCATFRRQHESISHSSGGHVVIVKLSLTGTADSDFSLFFQTVWNFAFCHYTLLYSNNFIILSIF